MISLEKPEIFSPVFEIVSCICECDKEILLLLRHDYKIEGNKWGLPAGKLEPNESSNLEDAIKRETRKEAEAVLRSAIRREVREETGLSLAPAELHYLNKVYVKYPTKDFIDHMFYAEFRLKPEIKLSQNEHKDYAWETVKKALKMNLLPGQAECFRLFYKL